VLHEPRNHGVITEVFRPEWNLSCLPVVQVYQSRLFPRAVGAGSCYARTSDRLFVNQGQLKAVL
jgi:dTDP-4-dehydrorhamnose 3,5-epimerase